MNTRTIKICIALAFIISCFLTFAHSLKCYTCINVKDCKKPKLLECNYVLANETREYLNLYYKGLPTNTINEFDCLSDWLKTSSSEMAHQGCVYSNFQSCTYSVRPYVSQNHVRSCQQWNIAKFNPADRASASLMTVVTTIIATVLAKYL